jgi:hypothetical protein
MIDTNGEEDDVESNRSSAGAKGAAVFETRKVMGPDDEFRTCRAGHSGDGRKSRLFWHGLCLRVSFPKDQYCKALTFGLPTNCRSERREADPPGPKIRNPGCGDTTKP